MCCLAIYLYFIQSISLSHIRPYNGKSKKRGLPNNINRSTEININGTVYYNTEPVWLHREITQIIHLYALGVAATTRLNVYKFSKKQV